ncbi:MAG: NAD(P)/FAD-dependent oxidoreductase [Cytophagales bacterium]|nr:FAD-dependent monooxygenase [Bernardetiaceae bacterium]MDW8204537.1 NAD(P)/FAD-dependent oxidoreductase [Cytophagales bacterium]
MLNKKENVVILGGGLVGSLMAVLLAKRGYPVTVYEGRPDPREKGYERGRSINLALSHRGWKALESAGIADVVKGIAIPMYGRMMHSPTGELTYQPYDSTGKAIYSVTRGLLNLAICNEAIRHGATFHFGYRSVEVNLKNNQLTLRHIHGNELLTVQPDILIGADGAFSAVRQAMQRTDRFNYSQSYIEYGYKELSIPPTPEGGFYLEKNALHIWPRGNFMLIALPNNDGSFTCTLFFPFEGAVSFEQLTSDDKIYTFFKQHFPDAVSLMPDLLQEFAENPTSSLITIRCNPWTYQGRVGLIGDAAHAIVPFYGQGMNAGFEDCRILAELLDLHQGNWAMAFKAYEKLRIVNANAIADLALMNFVEMRDFVANPKFLLRKKIEAHLHQLFPNEWIPLYTMVTFSDMPYSEALHIGKMQDEIMQRVMCGANIEENWESLDFEAIKNELVQKIRCSVSAT